MGPFELLQKIVEVFEHLQIPYLVTGSVKRVVRINIFVILPVS